MSEQTDAVPREQFDSAIDDLEHARSEATGAWTEVEALREQRDGERERAEQAERERDAAIEWHVERNVTAWINAYEGHVSNEDIERRERESRERVQDIVQRRAAEDAS